MGVIVAVVGFAATELIRRADDASAFHPAQPLQAAAKHVGFGIATVAAAPAMEGVR